MGLDLPINSMGVWADALLADGLWYPGDPGEWGKVKMDVALKWVAGPPSSLWECLALGPHRPTITPPSPEGSFLIRRKGIVLTASIS